MNIDPLLLSLANIGTLTEKFTVDTNKEDEEKLKKLISNLLGQNTPNILVRNISRKLNNRMFSKLYNAFAEGGGEENILGKFAQEIKDKRTYYELCKRSSQPCI